MSTTTIRSEQKEHVLSEGGNDILQSVSGYIAAAAHFKTREFRFKRVIAMLNIARATKRNTLPTIGTGWARDYFGFLGFLHGLEMTTDTCCITGAIAKICAAGAGVPFTSVRSRSDMNAMIICKEFFEVRKYPEIIQKYWDRQGMKYIEDPLSLHRMSMKNVFEADSNSEKAVMSIIERAQARLISIIQPYYETRFKEGSHVESEVIEVAEKYIAAYFSILQLRNKIITDERAFLSDDALDMFEKVHRSGMKFGVITSEDWRRYSQLFINIIVDPQDDIIDNIRELHAFLSMRDEDGNFMLSFSDIAKIIDNLFEQKGSSGQYKKIKQRPKKDFRREEEDGSRERHEKPERERSERSDKPDKPERKEKRKPRKHHTHKDKVRAPEPESPAATEQEQEKEPEQPPTESATPEPPMETSRERKEREENEGKAKPEAKTEEKAGAEAKTE